MPDTTHHPVPSPSPCIPDHGVPAFCWGCTEVCAVCRDAKGRPVLWPCVYSEEFEVPPRPTTDAEFEALPRFSADEFRAMLLAAAYGPILDEGEE